MSYINLRILSDVLNTLRERIQVLEAAVAYADTKIRESLDSNTRLLKIADAAYRFVNAPVGSIRRIKEYGKLEDLVKRSRGL